MVVVKFSSAIRLATGGKRYTEISKTGTIAEIIIFLCDHFGSEFSRRVLVDGKPREYLNFYLNGKDIRYLDNLQTRVDDHDVIDIIPAVAGG